METLKQANLPLLSVPAYYFMAMWPHVRAFIISNKGDSKNHDNRNPHSSQNADKIKKRLTAQEFATYERAKRCHLNSMENMPILVAAILAGLIAEQKAGSGAVGLSRFAVGWLVARTVYTANYLTAETIQWSYLRSVCYNIANGWALYTVVRAAFIIGG